MTSGIGRFLTALHRVTALDVLSVSLIAGATGVAWFVLGLELSIPVAAWVLALVWLSLQAAIILHECGHLVAGELVGCRWEVFKAGPALFVRSHGTTRLSFTSDPRYQGRGLVVSAPGTSGHALLQSVCMLLGGPVASLLCTLVAVMVSAEARPVPDWMRMSAAIFGACSFAVFSTTIVPATKRGKLSDGGKVLELLSTWHDREGTGER
jgi:hypothetical protein